MDPAQWIASFRITHDKAKRGELSPDERMRYQGMCEEFARSLMAAQNLSAPEGVPARRAFRVAQVYPIELENVARTMTRDVSCLGFTATASGDFKEGQQISWALTLARNTDPMQGMATVVSAPLVARGSYRVTATFNKLTDAQGDRLEKALIDAALSRFG